MSLLTYSGVTTKVRAMKSHLLTDAQFREMASLEDVRSAADFLKRQPAYMDIFSDLDDTRLHRGYIEQLLVQSQYEDFSKLYRFSSLSQRKFLDLYFMHYEIELIKRILRHVINHEVILPDLSRFQEFYQRHSSLSLMALAQSESITDFVTQLEGSIYHQLFHRLADKAPVTIFDYELQLDLFYFRSVWKIKAKVLSKKEQKILDQCFGCRLDLLNVQWIYRAKKYYKLSPGDIYALLIPIYYKLKTSQIQQMAEASTLDDFYTVLWSTSYGKLPDTRLNERPDAETLYHQILNQVYFNTGRKHPYTIAILDSYLYFKERELKKIITTIEGIRYGLPAADIIQLAAKQ